MAQKNLNKTINPTTLPEHIQRKVKAAGEQLFEGITGIKLHTPGQKSMRTGKGQQIN